MSRRPPPPEVTDHAVLRYIERAHGVDVEAIRAHIAETARIGVEHRAKAVISGGVKFILKGGRVITCYRRGWYGCYDTSDGGGQP